MKVLQVFNSIEFSGAEIMFRIAADPLKQAGFELHAISTRAARGAFADKLGASGYRIHHLPLQKSIGSLLRWHRFLKQNRFDVIHIHPERAFLLVAFLAWMVGTRIIVRTVHSSFQFEGNLRKRKSLERKMARKLFGVKMTTIGPSVFANEKTRFQNKTTIVPNWLDETRFYPGAVSREEQRKKLGYADDDKVVLTVGSCQPVKRHEEILRAMSKLQNPKIKYLQVGDGPSFDAEKQLAKELGIEDQVQFIQNLAEPEQAYCAADLFVMTSKYEGLGNAALEAMNCGLVPILYNVLGLRDFLLNDQGEICNRAGRLIDPDHQLLAETIKELASADQLRQKMSVEARKWVKSRFSYQESMQALLSIYGVAEIKGITQVSKSEEQVR